MPNKDWYWDRFAVAQNAGGFDMHMDKQSASIKNLGVKQANLYESIFIDELYGTTGRQTVAPDGTIHNMSQEGWRASGWDKEGAIQQETAEVTWGLDLVRNWSDHDFEKHPVGSNEHYLHQTRGAIDWANYYNDNAYQKEFSNRIKSGKIEYGGTLKDYLTSTADETGAPTTEEKVGFIRGKGTEFDKHSLAGYTWENEYVDQFDPETAKPYTKTYLDVPDLWGAENFEKVLTPIEVIKPDSLPTLDTIKTTQVEAPDSIKHWGGIKSAPTGKFTAGGQ